MLLSKADPPQNMTDPNASLAVAKLALPKTTDWMRAWMDQEYFTE